MNNENNFVSETSRVIDPPKTLLFNKRNKSRELSRDKIIKNYYNFDGNSKKLISKLKFKDKKIMVYLEQNLPTFKKVFYK